MTAAAPRIDKIESGSGTLYMGANPEVGGSTPFQLVAANKRHQVLSPAGAITVKLPTAGIALGETWKITNTTTNVITIQSSDGSAIVSLGQGSLEFLALQNVPTGSAHWSNLGLLGIVGRTDGVAPAAGMVGEKITATLAGATGATVNTYYDDSGTLLLTPGSWDIYLNATVLGDIPGSVSGQTSPIGVLALRQNATTLIEGYVCSGSVSSVNFAGVGAFIWPVNIAANTTYKASVKWIPNSGSPTLAAVTLVQAKSSFFAVRRA